MSLFKPSAMVEGGGLLDNVNATVKSARIVMFDYAGKASKPVPGIEFILLTEEGEEVSQFWSVGKPEDWQPSSDGKKIEAIGRAVALNVSSNGAYLIKSIVNAGFPEDKITDEITCFEGMEAHFIRTAPATKRNVPARPARADGRVFEDTILTVDKIHKLPWEKKTSKATGKATPAPGPAVGGSDLSARATDLMLQILAEHPDGLTKQQIPGLIYKKIDAKDPQRNQIVQTAFSDSFLNSGPWSIVEGKITLG